MYSLQNNIQFLITKQNLNQNLAIQQMYGGSYGSSYGTGMGTYGSSYGGYGSSYGSMGSYGGSYGASTMYGAGRNLNQQQQQQQPQQNQRRKVFEEYFKMMGGMRSILELGFAGVAFANFSSRAWKMVKKIFLFLLQTSSSFAKFVAQYIPLGALQNALAKTTGSNNSSVRLDGLLMIIVRIVAIGFLAMGYQLMNQTKNQINVEYEELEQKSEEIKAKKQQVSKKLQKYRKQGNL